MSGIAIWRLQNAIKRLAAGTGHGSPPGPHWQGKDLYSGLLGDDTARPVGPKPEARRAETRVIFLGKGRRAPSPPARGLEERCKLPQWGPGLSPDQNRFSCISKFVERISWCQTGRNTVTYIFQYLC